MTLRSSLAVLICALALGATTATAVAATQRVVLAVFAGGSIDDLTYSAPDAASLWFSVDGALVGYTVGAPAFVNASVVAHFANGIPANTPVIVAQSSSALPPSTLSAVRPSVQATALRNEADGFGTTYRNLLNGPAAGLLDTGALGAAMGSAADRIGAEDLVTTLRAGPACQDFGAALVAEYRHMDTSLLVLRVTVRANSSPLPVVAQDLGVLTGLTAAREDAYQACVATIRKPRGG